MVWTKILSILGIVYKIIVFIFTVKKGQSKFADTHLDFIVLETNEEPSQKIVIQNINQSNFNENKKTVSFVNNIGAFTFNIDNIKSLTMFDGKAYEDYINTRKDF